MDKSLITLLQEFGLTPVQQTVYLVLAETSWLSVLKLSQKTGLKRTSLYRVLDELMTLGVVKTHTTSNTSLYAVTGPQAFEALATQQQLKAKRLRQTLTHLTPQLQLLAAAQDTQLETKLHRGIPALQALEWQMTSVPNSEMLVLGIDRWVNALGTEFAELVREEREQQRVVTRELLNPDQFVPIETANQVPWTRRAKYVQECYRHRQLPTQILTITSEHIILPATNQIILFSFESAQPMAVELVGRNLCHMWTELFQQLWSQAEVKDNWG